MPVQVLMVVATMCGAGFMVALHSPASGDRESLILLPSVWIITFGLALLCQVRACGLIRVLNVQAYCLGSVIRRCGPASQYVVDIKLWCSAFACVITRAPSASASPEHAEQD